MSDLSIFIIALAVTIIAIYAMRRRRVTDQEFLEETFEPKELNPLQVWLCQQNNHKGNAHHVIESNSGTHKVRCFGCGTVFLEGRQIKVILTK